MSIRSDQFLLLLTCLLWSNTSFSQIIWQEDFNGANQGWTQNFTDCDGTPQSFAGVQNGRFEVIDMEGAPCCASGGGNGNEWLTDEIDISSACSVSLSASYGFTGIMECEPGGPYFGCSGNVNIDNGHDQMLFEYSLDGGPFVTFTYVCGPGSGIAAVGGLVGNTVRIRVRAANKATTETYWFDVVTVTGAMGPTVNQPNDVTVCAGQGVSVNFTGSGNPPITYSWTNDNPSIGLAASGTGNISFNPPTSIMTQQVANITVTPSSGGCDGMPAMFTITVNPLPTVNNPGNITACAGGNLAVNFSGNNPNSTYNWVASVPLPGGSINGTGDINVAVPPIPVPVTATVTVTATADGCAGPPQIFNVTVSPTPSGNLALSGSPTICSGANATFSVTFTGGTPPYTFVYAIDGMNQAPINTSNNPYILNVPLTNSGTVSLVEVTSNGCTGAGTGSANITVTPAPTATITSGNANICTGETADIEIEFTGTGPFTFIYRINGINQPSITTPGPNYTITASPGMPGVYNYTLFSVSSNGCTGMVSGAQTVTVAQAPTGTLTGGGNVCAGQGTPLTITFGGTGPFTFDYTADGIPQGPITTSNNPFVFVVAPSATTTYELTDVSANGCVGIAQGTAIVTVNPSPTATLVSGDSTICSAQPVDLVINLSGPSPYTFVYAVNNVNQPSITTSQSTYTITVSPNTTSTYTLVSVSGGGCTGQASGTFTITVGTPPSAMISGDTTICPGDTASLIVDFTGTGPFTFIYAANGINADTITTSNDPYILQVSPGSTTAYTLKSVSSNGCTGTFSGMATVNLAPTVSATISGGGQICLGGDSISITVSFLGAGPYTFTYLANNVPQPPITTSSNPYTFNVKPNIGTVYKLASVSNGNCDGNVSGQAVVFVFTPPTAILTGDQSFCDSANTTVMVDFTGTGPFTIIYTIDGVAQAPDTTFDDPFIIPVNTTTTTTYELISVESPGCVGTPQGTATITINYPPTYANLDQNCNLAAGTYTVQFDVLGATLPLTLISGSGMFNGSQFTSNPIPIGTDYSFTFHDANDCGDVTVMGPSTCNCTTEAGTMNLTALTACVGDTITAIYNNNFVNDGDDILRFILHTNPAIPIGTILAWSDAPSFGFQPGMMAGVTYYISAIAGNNNGSGLVDLNDLCLSIAQGTPVTFYALPTANLGAGDTICAGGQAVVPVTLTGVAPFSLTWALNGVQQPTVNNIPNSTYNIAIQPVASTVLTLVAVSDSRCSSAMADTANIVVNTPPQISNLSTLCDFNTMTYTLSFTVTGVPPFNVSGVGGSFSGNIFTSVPIPTSSSYMVDIADALGCGQTTISGNSTCVCTTDAGTMDQTQLNFCVSDTAMAFTASGSVLDTNDVLLYILHSNPGEPVGTIWGWNTTPNFAFQPGMMTNVVYYISAVAGNPSGTGQIDLTDPCLSVATGTPVVFQALPQAELVSFDTSICQNQLVTLTVNFTGTPPFSFNTSIFGTPQTPVSGINSNTYSWTSSYNQNTVIQMDSVSDLYCSMGTVLGAVNISVYGVPSITNVQTQCDSATQTYTVSFDILNGVAPFTVNGQPGTVTGAQFLSAPIPSGDPYLFYLSDVQNCGQDSTSGTVICSCVTMAGTLDQTALTLCADQAVNLGLATGTVLDANDTLIYVLVTTTDPATWTILATNDTPDFGFMPGTMMPGTTYFVVAIAGDNLGNTVDLNDMCLSIAIGPAVTWRPQVTADLSGMAVICPGDSASLTVQFAGDGPYTFEYTENGAPQQITTSQNPYTLVVTPATSATYNLVSVAGAGNCGGTVSGSATVAVNTLQVLNVQTICDLAAQTYVLQFEVSNGAAPNSVYTVSGVTGVFSDSTFTSNPISALLPFNVTVTDPNGCSQTVAGEADCLCDTDAGTLTAVTANGCLPDGLVSVMANGDQSLESDDVLQYILYQDPTQLPLGIIATSNTPSFGFQAGMTAGTTYFIAAMAGNNNGTGAVDTLDPCLSISPGIPVIFRNPPTAVLAGDTTFCAGGNAAFKIVFTGAPPFTFVYTINNVPQAPITSPGLTFTITTTNVQQNQTFTLVSVTDKYCSGTVNGQATVTITPSPSGSLIGDATICAGGTATLGLILSGGSPYDVTITGGPAPIQLTGVQSGATFDVTPSATTTYTISALTATGNMCPPVPGAGATVNVSDPGATAVLSDYNGFGVSCPNGEDGSIDLTLTGGTPPVNVSWDNGLSGLQLSNLDPGTYTVTLTDLAGCVFIDSFTLTAPPELVIELELTAPKCFGARDGAIELISVQGGPEPYTLGINGQTSQVIDTFPVLFGQLTAGDYTLEITDLNGCVTETDVELPAPLPFNVNLGPDITVNFGDSTIITAVHNAFALDSLLWSPTDYLLTPDSLTTYAKPPESQTYTIRLIDTSGCVASDDIRIAVVRNKRVFFPNIIKPSSEEANDAFTVFAGPEVSNIRTMQIYDRWGEMLFENTNFDPNIPQYGWNGHAKGKEVNPGVYVYVVEVEFIDGSTEVYSGDVTVVR
ncbi:MAG: gliding motility-associated C-terminal domain-containing protein [Lewinellaceae bacterium]|nr:gliding motility-associated C-terminal domain-containing protein [Lewinellaceae bacterium]